MALTQQQILKLAGATQDGSEAMLPQGMLKPQVVDLIQAVSTFVDSIGAAYNAALPEPFKSLASPAQKKGIFFLVAAEEAGRKK